MKHKNFRTQEDPFAKNAQGISTIYHEGISLLKVLQTKPQVKNMNINHYDLYYTVIKSRDDKDIIADEKDYIFLMIFYLLITCIGIRTRETIMRLRNVGS